MAFQIGEATIRCGLNIITSDSLEPEPGAPIHCFLARHWLHRPRDYSVFRRVNADAQVSRLACAEPADLLSVHCLHRLLLTSVHSTGDPEDERSRSDAAVR